MSFNRIFAFRKQYLLAIATEPAPTPEFVEAVQCAIALEIGRRSKPSQVVSQSVACGSGELSTEKKLRSATVRFRLIGCCLMGIQSTAADLSVGLSLGPRRSQLPWDLAKMCLELLSIADLGCVFLASRAMQQQVVRYLNGLRKLECNLAPANRDEAKRMTFGVLLTGRHCRSLHTVLGPQVPARCLPRLWVELWAAQIIMANRNSLRLFQPGIRMSPMLLRYAASCPSTEALALSEHDCMFRLSDRDLKPLALESLPRLAGLDVTTTKTMMASASEELRRILQAGSLQPRVFL